MTGGSAAIGSELLRHILNDPRIEFAYCGVHKAPVPVSEPRLQFIPLDLETGAGLEGMPGGLDAVVHLGGVSRVVDPKNTGRPISTAP